MAFERMSLFVEFWCCESLSRNVAFYHCRPVAANKNEIRLRNNVKNISFVLFAKANTKHEYYIFSWLSFPFDIFHVWATLSTSIPILHTLYSTDIHISISSLFCYCCSSPAMCQATSKVNFISIDVAIFPILPYFAFATMPCHHFLGFIFCYRFCLQNHWICVFPSSTKLLQYVAGPTDKHTNQVPRFSPFAFQHCNHFE